MATQSLKCPTFTLVFSPLLFFVTLRMKLSIHFTLNCVLKVFFFWNDRTTLKNCFIHVTGRNRMWVNAPKPGQNALSHFFFFRVKRTGFNLWLQWLLITFLIFRSFLFTSKGRALCHWNWKCFVQSLQVRRSLHNSIRVPNDGLYQSIFSLALLLSEQFTINYSK